MESVQSYVEKVREHTEDPDHLRANEALASLVEGRTSPADTANIITSIYAASLESDREMPKSDRCSKFHEFWAPNFSDFVRHHSRGEAQERLIDLLVEISRQPDLRYKDGSAAMDDAGHVYWRDLPGWNFHFADEGLHFSAACVFSPPYPPDRVRYLAQLPFLLSATRFAATLLQRGEFASAFPTDASFILHMALEHSYDEHSNYLAQVDEDEWEALLPLAGAWLPIAGEAIYSHCVGDDESNGWGKWDVQRWEGWKKQLEKFAKRDSFNEECRGLAAQTLKKMINIEAGHQG